MGREAPKEVAGREVPGVLGEEPSDLSIRVTLACFLSPRGKPEACQRLETGCKLMMI